MRALVLIVVALAATSARAASRGIDDCEAINDAMAYNACLASFGPTRASRAPSRGGYALQARGVPPARAAAPRGVRVRRVSYGRVHMEFTTRH